ncbi:MAG: hypothetical protein KBT19_06830 [Lachnospiraceae bacterium]|nr:hypothetical protein [Candidatus Colinaster equi]
MNRKYIYTNKKQSYKGIMASILGVINIVAIWYAIYSAYLVGGNANLRQAAAMCLTAVLSLVGIVLGITGKNEVDRFYLFAYVGIVLNALAIIGISAILYAGAYGL